MKDDQFIQLQKLIHEKEQMLLNKQASIKHLSSQNQYLDTVKNDYSNYYSYIVKQHNHQIMALEMLHQYMEDLSLSGQLSEHNIKDAKQEQSNILKEVKQIKKKIDTIIGDDEY